MSPCGVPQATMDVDRDGHVSRTEFEGRMKLCR